MSPPYVSPLRESQAAQTRERILDAAARIFAESGYSGTSLARIAQEAGVSNETVKQNGPKSALLLAAFDRAFSGAEGDGPLSAREMGDEADRLAPERLVPFLVAFVTTANERVSRLWPRLLEAAASDVEVARRLGELQASRRTDMLGAVAMFRQKGLCHGDRPDAERAEELSFLISPESHTQLVVEAGWSRTRYEQWMQTAIERLILAA